MEQKPEKPPLKGRWRPLAAGGVHPCITLQAEWNDSPCGRTTEKRAALAARLEIQQVRRMSP